MGTSGNHITGSQRRRKILIAALSILSFAGIGTTTYFWKAELNRIEHAKQHRLTNERLLGEKLQLEKAVAGLNEDLKQEQATASSSALLIDELRGQVQDAVTRSRNLAHAGQRNSKEVAELRTRRDQLEGRLTMAESNALELEDQVARLINERDGLAQELKDQRSAAQMVNNAEVDALRGGKGKITVVARRTREIRMAFDLPQVLAEGAAFKIIAPDGSMYTGADPSVSTTIDLNGSEPLASTVAIPLTSPGDRAARIHLKFSPTKKLLPGTYRIDVMSDGVYLNTVLLNLR